LVLECAARPAAGRERWALRLARGWHDLSLEKTGNARRAIGPRLRPGIWLASRASRSDRGRALPLAGARARRRDAPRRAQCRTSSAGPAHPAAKAGAKGERLAVGAAADDAPVRRAPIRRMDRRSGKERGE